MVAFLAILLPLYHLDQSLHNILTRFLEEEVMENFYQIIAKNVLVLRNEAGLSQLELATSAEIALKTLYAIEHAHANLQIEYAGPNGRSVCCSCGAAFRGNAKCVIQTGFASGVLISKINNQRHPLFIFLAGRTYA